MLALLHPHAAALQPSFSPQLPQGAMALDGAVGTISRDIKLAPYTSIQLQQTFYFPQPGVYLQAPVSVVTVTGR